MLNQYIVHSVKSTPEIFILFMLIKIEEYLYIDIVVVNKL